MERTEGISMIMRKYLSILFIGLMGPMISSAQQDLSLSDAIQIGLRNNYGIQIEKKRVEIAENNNNWGEAGRYPTVTLSLNQNNNVTDNVKTANPFQPQGIAISNSVVPGVVLNWTLFNGFKVNMTKQRLDQLQSESEGNADIVISNTIQAIILAYYNAVLQDDQLKVLRQNLLLSKDKYDYLLLKKKYGTAVTSDLLLEEGNFLTDSVSLINQELSYRDAIRNLNATLAEQDVDKAYRLIDQLPVEPRNYELIPLADKMTRDNIDLKKQYLSQAVVNSQRRVSQAERWPTLAMNFNGSNNNGRIDYSNSTFPGQDASRFADPLSSITNNYTLGFSLSFNLFNGGKINRAIKNAIIQEDIASIETDNLVLSLRKDLSSAFDNYQLKKSIYAINLRKKEAAQLNLELSEDKFKNGTINSFDYRTVQNNYQNAAVQELTSRYQLVEAEVELMRLTGGLIETYKEELQK